MGYYDDMQTTLLSIAKEVGTQKLFRAGSSLYFQGEVPRDLCIIQDGIVRGYSITSSGDERILAFYSKGDIVPLAWALGGTTASFSYYEAVNDVRAIMINRIAFTDLVEKNSEFAQAVLRASGREYTGAVLRIASLTQSRTIDKLAYSLYYLGYRFGIERPGGEVLINMKLSQIILASMIGQTREGTARNLKELVDKKAVSYKGSAYSVQMERLLSLLGEEDFRKLI